MLAQVTVTGWSSVMTLNGMWYTTDVTTMYTATPHRSTANRAGPWLRRSSYQAPSSSDPEAIRLDCTVKKLKYLIR